MATDVVVHVAQGRPVCDVSKGSPASWDTMFNAACVLDLSVSAAGRVRFSTHRHVSGTCPRRNEQGEYLFVTPSGEITTNRGGYYDANMEFVGWQRAHEHGQGVRWHTNTQLFDEDDVEVSCEYSVAQDWIRSHHIKIGL